MQEQPPYILLAHGGGGKLMHSLIENVFLKAFGNPLLDVRHDGAVVELPGSRVAFTTDSYVVHPLFFPGGDIGTLAVNGTVNDLAMCGARPLCLSTGFIIEEGLEIATLERIANSMREAASQSGVAIVTGDTKVVDHGKGDGVFINTAGIGIIEHDLTIAPGSVRPGDAVVLSGDLGRHGIAIMAVREGIKFETTLHSDCAPMADPVLSLIRAGIDVHCLRDLTRGGLASALVEIAESAKCHIHLTEDALPICEEVKAACEILGLDPLYVANEGRFVAFVSASHAEQALKTITQYPCCALASIIGEVRVGPAGLLTMQSKIGAGRIVDMLSGEQLPRIC